MVESPPQAARERSILVVEDDEDIRNTLLELLMEEGYPASGAEHGEHAWGLLQSEFHPALIMLDLMMPVMNGWQLLERLQQNPRLAQIPVVVLSALRNQVTLPGVVGYVQKPVTLEILFSVLEKVLGPPTAPHAA